MTKQDDLIKRLTLISDISSQYAPVPGSIFEKNSEGMLSEIKTIENSIQLWTSKLHYLLAIAYRNYTSWYLRGEKRQSMLKKIVEHLEQATCLDDRDFESKIELARILIEESQIRNLEKALLIVEELNESNATPQWMNSIIEKAKRWKGDIELPKNNNFAKLDPTPAVLREERTKLRKVLAESLKANDHNSEIIASRLYNLGLLVAYLYDVHDCNSGVMGMVYDNAAKKMKGISKKFNFVYLGRIKEAGFLTDMDYKRIAKVFGEKQEEISLQKIKTMVEAQLHLKLN